MTIRKSLIISENADLIEMLKEQLELRGEFAADSVSNTLGALEKIKKYHYDIVLVDDTIAEIGGHSVCATMREKGVKSPIIMLSSSNDEAEIVSMLDAGANDFVKKPFRIKILMARIRARIREMEQSEFAVFQVGPYRFQPADKLMVKGEGGQVVRLTEKETAIIRYLYFANEGVVSRDVLLGEVWGYNAGVTTHTLETHVYRLRQKIEKDPSHADILVTEQSGYRLIC